MEYLFIYPSIKLTKHQKAEKKTLTIICPVSIVQAKSPHVLF
ncbi:hypothetical protein CHCC20335_3362 [Bacillus paralicheniformis]|nr:hypothetical protein CHCC20335_3362 [Bacillus paralicheniformis]